MELNFAEKLRQLHNQEKTINVDLAGQKILIYGSNNVGKTRQSMNFEKPLLLMGESGGSAIANPNKTPLSEWMDFVGYVDALTNDDTRDDMKEMFQTIILDTVESVVYLSDKAICKRYKVSDLSELNSKKDAFGKQLPNGYVLSRNAFKDQINRLTMYGYTVIFITHDEVSKKINPITGEETEFIIPFKTDNEKSSNRFIRDLADFTFYVRNNGIDIETGKPLMSTAYCYETNHAFARSRYDCMPLQINPFTAENIKNTILEGMRKDAENQGGTLKVFEINVDNYTAEQLINAIKPYMMKLSQKYGETVKEVVQQQLGMNARVSEATDEQIEELKSIYIQLKDFANDRGVVVE